MSTLTRDELINLIVSDDIRDIVQDAGKGDYRYISKILIEETKPYNLYSDEELLDEWSGRAASQN